MANAHNIAEKLKSMGLSVPEAPTPAGSYLGYREAGGLLYIAGQLPIQGDIFIKGKLGAGLTVEQGQEAARLCALNILAQAKAARGSLDNISRIIRITGFVNSAPDFHDHPKVINAASDLFAALMGDDGRHSRVALGVAALPLGAAVEIDAIIE